MPSPAASQADPPLPGSLEVILDASGSMRGRIGETDRITLATQFVEELRRTLAETGDLPPMALRVYGAGSHRLRRDCTDTRLLVELGQPPARFDEALAEVRPLGVSPLALALRRAAADTALTYVLIADGGDNCEGDPCPTWREAVRGRSGRRARLHVVGVGPDTVDVGRLRCLSRGSSGTYVTIGADGDVAPAAERLALVLRDQGVVDVRLDVAGERFSAPVRLLRPLTGEIVAAFNARGPRRVPAGIYSLVVETVPAEVVERVMVLPGETVTIARSNYGRLVVELRAPDDPERRFPVSVRSASGGPELRYFQTGDPVTLRAGLYDVRIDTGDTLVARDDVAVSAGRTARLVLGGARAGTLRIVAPEFEVPPPTRALVYREGRVDTLAVGAPARLAPGVYRLVAQTLPPYVAENVRVESEQETVVTLPETGVLGVRLIGPEGPLRGVRVDVREPLTDEAYGAIPSGERRLVMPGTFRLEVRSAPPLTIDDVVVGPGEERIVERRGLSGVSVVVPRPERRPVRLELWTENGSRLLASATGPQPLVAARPGTYLVRIWRETELLWEGSIPVASDKTARIHLPAT